jgi:hypothetical protein
LKNSIEQTLLNLETWISAQEYKGYDPYDGLNSGIYKIFPLKTKYTKIAFIQLLKRCPFNLRKLFFVQKGYNLKGLGLFLSGYINLYKTYGEDKYKDKIEYLINVLKENISSGYTGMCWGYNFDWQSRAFFVPKGTPNIICTSFIANAFLDAYEQFNDQEYLNIARSACDFCINDLNITKKDDSLCFSYTPVDKSQIHNANLLAASLLIRVYHHTKEDILKDYAEKAVRFSIASQNEEGAWAYGNAANQKWVDNFHTGFNLVALKNYMKYSGNVSYKDIYQKGSDYFKENFFHENVIPKYYHNKIFPIDIHSIAQSIVTFVLLKDIYINGYKKAQSIADWGIANMLDNKGYFYFQKKQFYLNRIPYMRWSQAWMFYALSVLVAETKNEEI